MFEKLNDYSAEINIHGISYMENVLTLDEDKDRIESLIDALVETLQIPENTVGIENVRNWQKIREDEDAVYDVYSVDKYVEMLYSMTAADIDEVAYILNQMSETTNEVVRYILTRLYLNADKLMAANVTSEDSVDDVMLNVNLAGILCEMLVWSQAWQIDLVGADVLSIFTEDIAFNGQIIKGSYVDGLDSVKAWFKHVVYFMANDASEKWTHIYADEPFVYWTWWATGLVDAPDATTENGNSLYVLDAPGDLSYYVDSEAYITDVAHIKEIIKVLDELVESQVDILDEQPEWKNLIKTMSTNPQCVEKFLHTDSSTHKAFNSLSNLSEDVDCKDMSAKEFLLKMDTQNLKYCNENFDSFASDGKDSPKKVAGFSAKVGFYLNEILLYSNIWRIRDGIEQPFTFFGSKYLRFNCERPSGDKTIVDIMNSWFHWFVVAKCYERYTMYPYDYDDIEDDYDPMFDYGL